MNKMSRTVGTVDLSQDGDGLHLGALPVIGNVSFTGGKYFAKIVGDANSVERNRWISTGTFTTTAAATITPVVTSGTLDTAVRRAWNVITSDLGIPMTAVLPAISDANFTGQLYDERKEFDLKW